MSTIDILNLSSYNHNVIRYYPCPTVRNDVGIHTFLSTPAACVFRIFTILFRPPPSWFPQNGSADFIANGTVGKLTHENVGVDIIIIVLSRWITEILGVCQLRGFCFVNPGLMEDTLFLFFCQTNFSLFGELIWQ